MRTRLAGRAQDRFTNSQPGQVRKTAIGERRPGAAGEASRLPSFQTAGPPFHSGTRPAPFMLCQEPHGAGGPGPAPLSGVRPQPAQPPAGAHRGLCALQAPPVTADPPHPAKTILKLKANTTPCCGPRRQPRALTWNLSTADLEWLKPLTEKGTKNMEIRIMFQMAITEKAWAGAGRAAVVRVPALPCFLHPRRPPF